MARVCSPVPDKCLWDLFCYWLGSISLGVRLDSFKITDFQHKEIDVQHKIYVSCLQRQKQTETMGTFFKDMHWLVVEPQLNTESLCCSINSCQASSHENLVWCTLDLLIYNIMILLHDWIIICKVFWFVQQFWNVFIEMTSLSIL